MKKVINIDRGDATFEIEPEIWSALEDMKVLNDEGQAMKSFYLIIEVIDKN